MFAIIQTGGKQYKVKKGDVIEIEKIDKKKGSKIKFDKVLLISSDEGRNFKIGKSYIKGAKVEGEILDQIKGKKITIIKYKPKTRYKRKKGHRQLYTKVRIGEIS